MVLKPEKEEEAEAVFRKWGLDFAVVGETTADKRFIVRHRGETMADLPIKELGSEAPVYHRPFVTMPKPRRSTPPPCRRRKAWPTRWRRCSLRPISAPSAGCGSNTTISSAATPCSGRAATPRCCASRTGRKGLALTTDVTPRYCEADPFEGGKQAVAECWRNSDRGRRHPARHHRQSQFRQSRAAGNHGPVRRLRARHRRSLQGARFPGRLRQCLALQRDQARRRGLGRAILPTPSIGGVGLIDGFRQIGVACLQARGRGDPADRRNRRLARPVDLSCAKSADARRARRRRST